jgi:hypothetical protein
MGMRRLWPSALKAGVVSEGCAVTSFGQMFVSSGASVSQWLGSEETLRKRS